MSRYQGPFFDVDVHHRPHRDIDILDYLPSRWHDYVRGGGQSRFALTPPFPDGVLAASGINRDDSKPANGVRAGSDYDTMCAQLLDREADYRVLLTHQTGEHGGHPNQYFARDLARAMNDWTADAWLSRDKRVFAPITIPLAEPDQAAKEIARVADHPQMIGVLLAGNVLGRPLGDPLYHPIYRAAAERNLPIVCHISLLGRPNVSSLAAGGRLSFLSSTTQTAQQVMHYVSSLIVHGVFEQFPGLKFLFTEYGIGWLPYGMMRMDDAYSMLKAESPWVKRLPSEYVREHIRLSTQPLEESFDNKSALFDLLGTVDGVEDILCFSSDYPHGTMDDPKYIVRRLPEAWRDKVLYRNACKLFGLPEHTARELAGSTI